MGLIVFIYAGIASLAIPTMYGDNAFYLGRKVAFENFNFFRNVQLQGLLEFTIISIFNDGKVFIPFYKFFVILLNFSFYTLAFYKRNNKLLILFTFSAAQFYLAPSMFSLSVAGFSLIYISSKSENLSFSIITFVLALFLVGYELPNPKYLILAFLLYIFYFFMYETYRYKNLLIKNILLLIFFIVIMFYLLYAFTITKGQIILNYDVINTELLDLVGRGFVSAIAPYKQNRFLAYLYISILLYLLIYLIINLKSLQKKLILIIIFIYISLGILEPTGIINFLVFNYGIFGFLRTRAGFDLFLFFILIGIYIQFEQRRNIYFYYFSILIFCTLVMIESPKMFAEARKNYSLIKIQGEFINFINIIDKLDGIKCFISNADYYADNSIFSFGPPVYKLTTNYLQIKYDENNLKKMINKCDLIIFDTNEVNYFNVIKYYNKNIIYKFNTFVVL